MESRKLQVRVNSYLENCIKDYASTHSMNISECIQYVLTKFFDDYEREMKGNGKNGE